jgi:hypothetical protein
MLTPNVKNKGETMQEKTKDMQPPYQEEREGLSIDEIEENREGWDVQKLANEASQKDGDEIQRQTLRGDETKGNPDNRDNAGSVDSGETPHGREEAKNDAKGKENING